MVKKLHKGKNDTVQFEPNEGQSNKPLCSNNELSLHCPSLSSNQEELSDEAITALINGLGQVLRDAYKNMLRQGYDLVDGRVCKINSQQTNERENE